MDILNITKIRTDFPLLNQIVHGKPLVYLDNGATTQKPKLVIDNQQELYSCWNANIHRGVHYLSEQCTEQYENARKTVQQFINAESLQEVVFTSGTTASINLVASSFGEQFIKQGDEVLVSEMEHHSNIVPWKLLCNRKGAILKVLPFNDKGDLCIDLLDELLTDKTRIVAVTQVSNVLGTINPVAEIIRKAHARNIPVLVDGAQGIQHGGVDVQAMDCDFYVFSGHKLYAPTGTGVLYGKKKWLDQMPPWQGGGEMIANVSFDKISFAALPFKFEAGTPNYVGAISMGKAIDYLNNVGVNAINTYEDTLTQYAIEKITKVNDISLYGTSANKTSVVSFVLNGIHPYDTGMILDKLGIAVRTGHLCAEPTVRHFGIEAVVRASFCFYNTFEEVDILCAGLQKVKQMFA